MTDFAPGRRFGRWKDQTLLPPTRVPRYRGEPALDARAAKIRIVWHGQRITRMVFPSGRTVEFPL